MLLYLHGFASGPSSSKAQSFRNRFASLGLKVETPALDEGDFEHLTIANQLKVIDRFAATRPLIIVGSSLGGYLAALHAATHPVDALILMAPAVDFARRIEARYGDDFLKWRERGWTEVDHFALNSKARLSFDLIRDATNHEPWPTVSVPTLVLQGRRDDTVPHALVSQWVAEQPNARMVDYDSPHELTDVVDEMLDESEGFLRSLSLLP